MDCLNINILNYDANYLYPIMGACGLCMTYFGNKFVRPTIFSLGTILSMESSYKATHLILNHYDYTKNECLIKSSGVDNSNINSSDIVAVNITSFKCQSKIKPSTDTPTHIELYKSFNSIGAIAHTHSLYATAWAQSGIPIPCFGTTHAD